MNTVTLIGNLCRDIELKQAGSSELAEISLAVNEKVKRNDEWVDEPVFINVNVWGAQATNCAQYLKKGSKVAIIGRLSFDSWDDKETGKKRSKLFVTANKVEFLTPKGEQGNKGVVREVVQVASTPADDSTPPF